MLELCVQFDVLPIISFISLVLVSPLIFLVASGRIDLSGRGAHPWISLSQAKHHTLLLCIFYLTALYSTVHSTAQLHKLRSEADGNPLSAEPAANNPQSGGALLPPTGTVQTKGIFF